jgi:hypothetical protein
LSSTEGQKATRCQFERAVLLDALCSARGTAPRREGAPLKPFPGEHHSAGADGALGFLRNSAPASTSCSTCGTGRSSSGFCRSRHPRAPRSGPWKRGHVPCAAGRFTSTIPRPGTGRPRTRRSARRRAIRHPLHVRRCPLHPQGGAFPPRNRGRVVARSSR